MRASPNKIRTWLIHILLSIEFVAQELQEVEKKEFLIKHMNDKQFEYEVFDWKGPPMMTNFSRQS